jgi:hypothetical protein
VIALSVLLLAATAAEAPSTWATGAGSTLAYHLEHRFHSVDAVCHAVEGRARLLPDGAVQVMVRARVDGFDSGNGNRDAHMKEVTHAASHPFVLFKGVTEGVLPASYPADFEVVLHGVLELAGVAREREIPAHIRFETPERAQVTAHFDVSLTGHGVERPSLMFVPVEDALRIRVDLALTREPAAP